MSLHDVDFNTAARRGLLNAHLWTLVGHEPTWASEDSERLTLLGERYGDICAAFLRGHTDIDGEVQKLVATGLAWLDARAREAAR